MDQIPMRTNSWVVCAWKLTPLTVGFMMPDRFRWRNRTAQSMFNEWIRNRRNRLFRTDDMWSLWIEGKGANGVESIDYYSF